MKKIPIFILLLSALLFSQVNRRNRPIKGPLPLLFDKIFFSELITSNQDNNQNYFIYKVPANRLIFQKDNEVYKANFTVSLEFLDEKQNIVQRKYDEKFVEVDSYEKTKSMDDYVEGVIQIDFGNNIKRIIPTFTDLNNERAIKGKQINLIDNGDKLFSTPIIVKNNLVECDDVDAYEIANYGGDIPFSESKYTLLLPSNDLDNDELFVKIISNNDTLYNSSITNYFDATINIKYCNDKIVLLKDDDISNSRFYILENFDEKLSEGAFKLVVSNNSDFKNYTTFIKRVIWFDKPFSLRNPEHAIKYLNFIEEDSVIDKILDNDSFQYSKLLQKYWKKFDPTSNTTFNPIMKEYYERIDYSTIHFMPISRKSGATTDRGKIYIKYGKPNEIKRTSNTYGQVTEIWIYNNSKKEFVFIDKYGIGDFSLITG
ncbi:MAG: hypothetical protein COW08_09650 [Ignavibacteriales bacterium CG12_big_fil_rev_8_21_14_0_65_30_8]|nr:MAG: hypothetical protein COW08_09650 [Ignavibacteriales bacterium CG12_big_fil_rev_8_21_14_0_65_30_8]